ncbi:DHHC zinc finger domain-containing protein [Besnoitia besnoiti]|uniref:DHHC zinc finger domain-containing protein n=1 Tax=Besnoitia besnoiti TaxID=94643 RepID=A0A2A9MM31_BESBE|nr:DHHC zinc finger domain-containing protein [Besnoitia besnoiti]PFH36787.1 DHHC zinc finger domain-containing protein [Besnoitia besnoiti]
MATSAAAPAPLLSARGVVKAAQKKLRSAAVFAAELPLCRWIASLARASLAQRRPSACHSPLCSLCRQAAGQEGGEAPAARPLRQLSRAPAGGGEPPCKSAETAGALCPPCASASLGQAAAAAARASGCPHCAAASGVRTPHAGRPRGARCFFGVRVSGRLSLGSLRLCGLVNACFRVVSRLLPPFAFLLLVFATAVYFAVAQPAMQLAASKASSTPFPLLLPQLIHPPLTPEEEDASPAESCAGETPTPGAAARLLFAVGHLLAAVPLCTYFGLFLLFNVLYNFYFACAVDAGAPPVLEAVKRDEETGFAEEIFVYTTAAGEKRAVSLLRAAAAGSDAAPELWERPAACERSVVLPPHSGGEPAESSKCRKAGRRRTEAAREEAETQTEKGDSRSGLSLDTSPSTAASSPGVAATELVARAAQDAAAAVAASRREGEAEGRALDSGLLACAESFALPASRAAVSAPGAGVAELAKRIRNAASTCPSSSSLSSMRSASPARSAPVCSSSAEEAAGLSADLLSASAASSAASLSLAVGCAASSPQRLSAPTSSLLPHCGKCGAVRPPRTHHCRVCSRCVLRQDHHCPWLGQCVGLHNRRFFVLFLFFLFLLMIFSLWSMRFALFGAFAFRKIAAESRAHHARVALEQLAVMRRMRFIQRELEGTLSPWEKEEEEAQAANEPLDGQELLLQPLVSAGQDAQLLPLGDGPRDLRGFLSLLFSFSLQRLLFFPLALVNVLFAPARGAQDGAPPTFSRRVFSAEEERDIRALVDALVATLEKRHGGETERSGAQSGDFVSAAVAEVRGEDAPATSPPPERAVRDAAQEAFRLARRFAEQTVGPAPYSRATLAAVEVLLRCEQQAADGERRGGDAPWAWQVWCRHAVLFVGILALNVGVATAALLTLQIYLLLGNQTTVELHINCATRRRLRDSPLPPAAPASSSAPSDVLGGVCRAAACDSGTRSGEDAAELRGSVTARDLSLLGFLSLCLRSASPSALLPFHRGVRRNLREVFGPSQFPLFLFPYLARPPEVSAEELLGGAAARGAARQKPE